MLLMSTVKLHGFIAIYSKCAWVNPLRVKKNVKWSISKNMKELIRKPNRILVAQDLEFYNR